MISSKNLANAIYEISKTSKKDEEVIVLAILDYVKKYKLEALLPKAISYLENKSQKDSTWDTLSVESKIHIDNEIIEKIKIKLNATKAQKVKNEIKEELIGGFTATYKGVIYDASIKNQLKLLRNVLTK